MIDRDPRVVAYGRYARTGAIDYQRYASTYSRLLDRQLTFDPNWRCIDIACGPGNFLAYLRSRGIRSYLGVDVTEAATNLAKQEFGSSCIKTGDATSLLEAEKGSFDFVSALDFIEHLNRRELLSLLQAVHQHTASGGYFLVRTPNAAAPFGMAARYNDITHELCFTPNALSDLLQNVGFTTVEVWEDVGDPRTPLQFMHYVAWQVVRFWYRVLDSIETGAWNSGVMTRNFWLLARKM